MAVGYRHDVGLHHDGAQYAITIPVANVTTSWWVGVPYITGRQLVLELNTTWPNETRNIRANVYHATYGGDVNGTEIWNVTATGEQRRADDGFIYEGETGHTNFTIQETADFYQEGRINYILSYKVLPGVDGDGVEDCTCDTVRVLSAVCSPRPRCKSPPCRSSQQRRLQSQDLVELGIACEEQCPPDPADPRLSQLSVVTTFEYYVEEGEAEESGDWFYMTRVVAQIPVEYYLSFYEWGSEWLAETLTLDEEQIIEADFVTFNTFHCETTVTRHRFRH